METNDLEAQNLLQNLSNFRYIQQNNIRNQL